MTVSAEVNTTEQSKVRTESMEGPDSPNQTADSYDSHPQLAVHQYPDDALTPPIQTPSPAASDTPEDESSEEDDPEYNFIEDNGPEDDDPENHDTEGDDDPENDDPEADDPEADDPEADDPEADDPEDDDPEDDDPVDDVPENDALEDDDPQEYVPQEYDTENIGPEDDASAVATSSPARHVTPSLTKLPRLSVSEKGAPSWFAADPSKAYYEKFSLVWSAFSMALLLGLVLGTPIYKHCDRNSFLLISLLACLPGFAVPLLAPCAADRTRPLHARFWVKGTVWISIFGFYGNYFWTHYFYSLLGAEYLFDSYRLNDVPIVTFLCTFFYFTFYFNLVNIILRRIVYYTADFPAFARAFVWWTAIAVLSYGTAIFEALSIQHFPLYTYKERDAFLLIGSVVYGLYFIVGFPMFFALDETSPPTTATSTLNSNPDTSALHPELPATTTHTVCDTAMSALAAAAIVTLLLDLWRLLLGSIYDLSLASLATIKLPFIYQQQEPFAIAAVVTAAPSPTASPSVVYVIKEVTVDSCVNVAKSWAKTKVLELRSALQ